jgi:hypothetical protein
MYPTTFRNVSIRLPLGEVFRNVYFFRNVPNFPRGNSEMYPNFRNVYHDFPWGNLKIQKCLPFQKCIPYFPQGKFRNVSFSEMSTIGSPGELFR